MPFFFKTQWILYRWSNKSNRQISFKMESYEETAAAIVALLLVKKIIRKREKDPRG